jgi:tetraacyldisaccharide 4'-kinase
LSHRAEFFHNVVSGRRRGPGAILLRAGLRLASVPYGWATALRNRLFDRGWKRQEKSAVPVVSVGNLTLGGTGKTPCVEYIARFYREMGMCVAILSRGYGANQGPNDEALVLEENLPDVPHLQGGDRVALARAAVEELESEVLVLDDGFQHRRLARNLDVVLIDATNPWGHGYLFPRGLLRESPRGLKRAGVVVLTRCDQVTVEERKQLRDRVARFTPQSPVVEATHGPVELVNSEQRTVSLEELRNHPVAGVCGIGNPEAFRRTLTDRGANLCDFRTYADHHPYSRTDVEELRRWAARQPADCVVLTTQKDLVKLRLAHLADRPLWALRIRLQGLAENGLAALDESLKNATKQHSGDLKDEQTLRSSWVEDL